MSPKTQKWVSILALHSTIHREGMSIPNFKAIDQIVVETFDKKTKKNTNILLMVALEEKSGGSPKPRDFILWGPWISILNIMAIHSTVVETFQSGPKWLPNCHPKSHIAVAIKNLFIMSEMHNIWPLHNQFSHCLFNLAKLPLRVLKSKAFCTSVTALHSRKQCHCRVIGRLNTERELFFNLKVPGEVKVPLAEGFPSIHPSVYLSACLSIHHGHTLPDLGCHSYCKQYFGPERF